MLADFKIYFTVGTQQWICNKAYVIFATVP